MMSNFAESIRQEIAKMDADACENEKDTELALIHPIIQQLGYNIRNPKEFKAERQCGGGRVDYSIRNPETEDVLILIEAKPLYANLHKHIQQLHDYFGNVAECHHAILSNGLEWWFFSDLTNENIMDSEPYRKIDIRSLLDDDIVFLSGFCKGKFDAKVLRSHALIRSFIKKDIIDGISGDSLSDNIVRAILQYTNAHTCNGSRNVTKAVIDQFRPIITEELDRCFFEEYGVHLLRTDQSIEHIAMDNEEAVSPESPMSQTANITFPIDVVLSHTDGSCEARGQYLGGNRLIVLKGSKVSMETSGKLSTQVQNDRQKHVDKTGYVLEDVFCKTVSQAGAFVCGHGSSGGDDWKVAANGQSLKEYLGGNKWSEVSSVK